MQINEPYLTILKKKFRDIDVGGVKLHSNSFLSFLFGKFGQFAVTWNKQINITKNAYAYYLDNDNSWLKLFAHELVHVRQQQEMGWWKFLILYIWYSISMILEKQPANLHPFEAPAYAIENEVNMEN